MSANLSRFRHAIMSRPDLTPDDDALLIEREGSIACHYAPFEYVNPSAKVVLVGITPGAQQARNALCSLREALRSGASDADALAAAKVAASFSGAMRGRLVALLDRVGLHVALGLDSCDRLFHDRQDLAHFTSAIRYPVFRSGQNYSGNPAIATVPMLANMADRWLGDEVKLLPGALWFPLGDKPAAVLRRLVAAGKLPASQLLEGLPHPSPANNERIAYFVGAKARARLSAKTNPDLLDRRLDTLQTRLRQGRV